MCNPHSGHQPADERMVLPAPVGLIGTGAPNPEGDMLASLTPGRVFMMGDNPALPKMPDRPKLLDFFERRFSPITHAHLVGSALRALNDGQDEKIVMACLLHDIANGCFVRADHGYWGAQMIAPYVDPEIVWAVEKHQALRYYADDSVGYSYPASYDRFFGPDYQPPEYIRREAQEARDHRWYMSGRLVTLYDIYFFEDTTPASTDPLVDIIGRNFKPKEGLGFDGSPVAHMWRTMIWPNNFL